MKTKLIKIKILILITIENRKYQKKIIKIKQIIQMIFRNLETAKIASSRHKIIIKEEQLDLIKMLPLKREQAPKIKIIKMGTLRLIIFLKYSKHPK